MEVTYYLLGENAVRAYEENGIKSVLKNEDGFGLFTFIEGKSHSSELADALNGWLDWIIISKEEYKTLLNK